MVPSDEIGIWSEVKIEILRKYAAAYSTILSRMRNPSFTHVYIDGFSGSGTHISRSSGEFVEGSPLSALAVSPPFEEYYFVDLDGTKIDSLRDRVGARSDVHIFEGDCNRVLIDEVFPKVKYEDYRRGLCLLDPYGLHLDWEVMKKAGKMSTIDLFLNFPIMDMNRNALWKNPDRVSEENRARMTSFWGDESWQNIVYQESAQVSLFSNGPELEKVGNEEVAGAFRSRLREEGGFGYVPEPLPMRNSKGAVVYYLFFASQKPVARKIVSDIFKKYRF